MNFIQLVRCYVLLEMFASKSHTKSYIMKRHFLMIFKYYAWVSYDYALVTCDETSVSEQKGVMQWTGIKFGAISKGLLPWVSSIILVIYEVPEKRRVWFIFSSSYPP